jgi:glutaredoxin-like protein NrdH
MAIQAKHIEGKNMGDIKLFALSTCIWCGKTKKLLGELGIEYDFIDVDLLENDEQQEALKEIRKFNPAGGFPTMVIDKRDCIVGFDEKKIKDKFEK